MSSYSLTIPTYVDAGTNDFFLTCTLNPAAGTYLKITHDFPTYTNLVASNITGGGIYIGSPFSVQTPLSTSVTFKLNYSIPNLANTSSFVVNEYNSSNVQLNSFLVDHTTSLTSLGSTTLNTIRGTSTILNFPPFRFFVNFVLDGNNWANNGTVGKYGYTVNYVDATKLRLTTALNTVGQTFSSINVLQ